MKDILKRFNEKPIAYYPIYRKITGSTTGGILLSQLMYWFSKKDKIFKTDSEIMEETYLTKKELETAKKLIKQLDFITVSLEGLPAKTYYEINWEMMLSSFHDMGKLETPKGGNSTPQKVETVHPNLGKHTIYTENTTENTTDIKKINKKNSTLVDELEKEIELTENAKAILNDFLDYRKNIKKPIRTIQPLKAFLNEIRTIYKSGFDVAEAIEIMKSNEWQTIKLEYIQNTKKSNQVAIPKAENKTFYEQTEEAKQKKQQETLSNIAKVRELREQGLL
ncbi:MAG TPA: hypothetical protein VJY14_01200 [Aliarcobacter sp.]|nr:hypothetical protein [Aliarcobacter sp.]